MQRRNTGQVMCYLVAIFTLVSSLVLFGCGGGGDEDVAPATVADLNNRSFPFASGEVFNAALRGVATAVGFIDNAASFTLSSVGGSATGTHRLGSCILTARTSTYRSGTGPQANDVITLSVCEFDKGNLTLTVTNSAGVSATSSPGEAVKVAPATTFIQASATSVQAIEAQTFSLPAAAGAVISPALANQPITVTFTNTASVTPTATVTAPNVRDINGNLGARFTSTTTFGSCTFRVTQSTFPVGQGPQVGDTITVNPCQVNVQTGGVQATGQATTVQILLQLGQVPSALNQSTVSINSTTGVVTVNNVNTGQSTPLVTLQVITGSSGG